MDINILNDQFEKIAVVDYYTSLMWCRRYADIGAIDLQVEVNTETLGIFKKGYYITRDDDFFEDGNGNQYQYIYRIEALEIDTTENGDNYLVIGAYDCKQVLKQRIVWSVINFSGTAENYIRRILTENVTNPSQSGRKINEFAMLGAKGFAERIDQQTTYDNVCDKIVEVCKSYNLGWRIGFKDGSLYFDLYKGADHTDSSELPVVFSPDNENLISSKYNMNASDFKNFALVGGEGEGKERILETYGTATGLQRYETFVDASSTSTDTDPPPTTSEYKAILRNLGKEALADTAVVESFEGEVDTQNMYQFKVDYELGDLVTLENEYGIKADARITEVIETWDNEGYSFEPKFEYMEVEEELESYLLTENSLPLATQSGARLLTENSPAVETDSVKISELDPVDELFDGCCLPVVQEGETKKVYFSTLKGQIAKNPTITIKQGNVIKGSFTLNQTDDKVIELDAGGSSSQIMDAGYYQWQGDGTETIHFNKSIPNIDAVVLTPDVDVRVWVEQGTENDDHIDVSTNDEAMLGSGYGVYWVVIGH